MIEFLSIAAISQSLLLFFYFAMNRKKYTGYLYQSILLFIIALSILSGYLYISKKILNYPFLARTGLVFFSLIGGLFTISTRSILEKTNRIRLRDIVFFITPNIIFFYLLPFFLSDSATKIQYLYEDLRELHTDCYIIFILSALNNFAGVLSSFFILYKNQSQNGQNLTAGNETVLTKLGFETEGKNSTRKYLLYHILILGSIALTLLISLFNKNLINSGYYSFLISVLIILRSYDIIYRNSSNKKLSLIFDNPEKYEKSKIKNDIKEDLGKKIKIYLEKEKPFLDPDFNMKSLTDHFQITSHTASQIFADYFKKSFNQIVSEYRIHEAILKFKEPGGTKQNILNIALDSGFNSKSSFNSSFKKITGKTPTEYKKNVQTN